jgi:hypothetical protein
MPRKTAPRRGQSLIATSGAGYDQPSRTAPDLCATIAASMAVIEHHKMTHWGDTLPVLSPEHAAADVGLVPADHRRGRRGSNLVMRTIR